MYAHEYAGKFFTLEDHQSKFGTLVNIRKPGVIDQASQSLLLVSAVDCMPAAPLSVQIGRTVVALSIDNNPPPVGTCLAAHLASLWCADADGVPLQDDKGPAPMMTTPSPASGEDPLMDLGPDDQADQASDRLD